MENIYTQAIADAKAVRESAMANAKAAIQEAFEPKIKAMLKKHIVENEGLEEGSFMLDYNDAEYIQHMLDEEGINATAKPGIDDEQVEIHGDDEALKKAKMLLQQDGFDLGSDETEMADEVSMEEDYTEYDETMSPADEATPNSMDETTLDEILAELDEMDDKEATEELEEAFEMEEAKEEEEETEEESEEEDGEGEEESTEETKVVDITLGDLVDAIKAAMAGETPAATEEPEMEPKSDDISLDEILAELEEEMKEEGTGAESNYMDEAQGKFKVGDTVKITTAAVNDGGKTGKIVSVKMGEKYPYEVQVLGSKYTTPLKASQIQKAEEMDEAKKELKEAKKAIEAMRAELNEVNLLNAKLLYVNKIFKAKSLTEAQKVKVLNAFDKATTVKEVKNTYSIVSEAITAAPKKQLKESFGFASKPAGIAPKTNTMESDPFIARMQKLAGL